MKLLHLKHILFPRLNLFFIPKLYIWSLLSLLFTIIIISSLKRCIRWWYCIIIWRISHPMSVLELILKMRWMWHWPREIWGHIKILMSLRDIWLGMGQKLLWLIYYWFWLFLKWVRDLWLKILWLEIWHLLWNTVKMLRWGRRKVWVINILSTLAWWLWYYLLVSIATLLSLQYLLPPTPLTLRYILLLYCLLLWILTILT